MLIFIYEYTPFLEHKVPQLIHLNTYCEEGYHSKESDRVSRRSLATSHRYLTRHRKTDVWTEPAWPRCAVLSYLQEQCLYRFLRTCPVCFPFFSPPFLHSAGKQKDKIKSSENSVCSSCSLPARRAVSWVPVSHWPLSATSSILSSRSGLVAPNSVFRQQ